MDFLPVEANTEFLNQVIKKKLKSNLQLDLTHFLSGLFSKNRSVQKDWKNGWANTEFKVSSMNDDAFQLRSAI